MLIKIYTIYKGGTTFYSYAFDENSLLHGLERVLEYLVRHGIINPSEISKRGYAVHEYAEVVMREFLINGICEFKFKNVTIKIEPIKFDLPRK